MNLRELTEKVIAGYVITLEDANWLLKQDVVELCAAANQVREKVCGDKFDLCSITNAKSGKCSEDCKWCSQSAYHTTGVDVYDVIDSKEALKEAKYNHDKGVVKHSLVTSGKGVSDRSLDKLCNSYRLIKKEVGSLELCASMGLLTKDQLIKLKESGVSNYHCNIETAPSYFPELVTTHTIEQKVKTIKAAQEIGLKVCSGGIIGMGENMDQRIEMAFFLRDLGVKSIPVNILNAIKGTKLEDTKPLSDEELLRTVALYRFINRDADIRFAGGRIKILHLQEKALKSGINASIVGDLLTTIGCSIEDDLSNFSKAGFKFR